MTSVTVVVPMAIRRRGGRKQIIGPDGAPVRVADKAAQEARGDPVLAKALARAFRWRRMLEDGRYASISEMAVVEKINQSYVSRVLRLTLLAPDIVQAILDGRQPEGMTLPGLMEGVAVEWEVQRGGRSSP
jgi:hypothetical protein